MAYDKNGHLIDPASIYIIAFRCPKAGTLLIDDVYLTNEDPTPSGIREMSSEKPFAEPVYNLQGVKIGTKSQWQSVPRGIYVVDGKLVCK